MLVGPSAGFHDLSEAVFSVAYHLEKSSGM
jgi:hypothetical protein